VTHEQHEAIRRLLDDVGRAEGAQGIQSIAETGYRGDVPAEVLALFGGDESHARGHIRSEAYDIYSAPDFERS
jgi:hypothetical protein